MIKLLKSKICGYINSTHRTLFTKKSNISVLKKEKKKTAKRRWNVSHSYIFPEEYQSIFQKNAHPLHVIYHTPLFSSKNYSWWRKWGITISPPGIPEYFPKNAHPLHVIYHSPHFSSKNLPMETENGNGKKKKAPRPCFIWRSMKQSKSLSQKKWKKKKKKKENARKIAESTFVTVIFKHFNQIVENSIRILSTGYKQNPSFDTFPKLSFPFNIFFHSQEPVIISNNNPTIFNKSAKIFCFERKYCNVLN